MRTEAIMRVGNAAKTLSLLCSMWLLLACSEGRSERRWTEEVLLEDGSISLSSDTSSSVPRMR